MHLTLVGCGMTATDSRRTQFTVFYLMNFGIPLIFQCTLNGIMIPNDILRNLWMHQWPVLTYFLIICLHTKDDHGNLLKVAGLRTKFQTKDI